MVVIALLYLPLVSLAFSRLKLILWNWFSGTVATLLGMFILAVFVALLNYLTPSGKTVVVGRVVAVTPNVSGQIVSIPGKPNATRLVGELFETRAR
jgi:multidrug resistance efflux pump